MSDVSDHATVRILLADYASVDQGAKLNVIGGGVVGIGYLHETGSTAPFAVVASVSVPPAFYNEACAAEIVLEDASGQPVSLPGPTGDAQVMRVGQAIRFEEPKALAGISRFTLHARSQWVLNFQNGLPLPPGQSYAWRVKIDTESHYDWVEPFVVPGASTKTGPVLG